MKARRIMAILLALLMLAGLLPTAALAGECSSPDSVVNNGNHAWRPTNISTSATCTTPGYAVYRCGYCGETKQEQTEAALGHAWSDWTTSRAATCTAQGEEARTCSRCGARETRATATVDHTWGKWKTQREATCDRKGEEARKCAVCGQTEKRGIKEKPHEFGDWTVTRQPTCSEKGERERVCEKCGYVDTQSIETLPHTYGDWTVTLEPTCTAKGERTHACQVCGYEQTEPMDPAPHAFGEWTVTREATCTAEGSQTHACAACGLEETETVPPRGHRFGAWTVIAEMTDFSIGVYERACERCGYTEHEEREPQPTYHRGDKGDGVKGLQEALNAAGFDCGKVDGDFGKKTEAAVKAVEEAHSFQADGVAWPGVQKWLGMVGGKGPDDEGDDESGKLPDNINSTYSGGAPSVPPVFEDAGELFSARKFEVVEIPYWNSAYYAGANVLVKLRLTIDSQNSYRVVQHFYDAGDNFYANDWVYGGKTLEPGESYDMTYGMLLHEDPATWHNRRITLYLKNMRTGAIEQESVEFGPPWRPAKVTIVDQQSAKHIAGDSWAFLYLTADKDAYCGHVFMADTLDIPLHIDSDGTTEIRNLKLTVEQVNLGEHNEVYQTDTFKLKNKIMAGDEFDWLAKVLATSVTKFSGARSLHLKVSGVYYDKYDKPRIVESEELSLAYYPEKRSADSASLSLEGYVTPWKNVYGPGDRVTVHMTVTNDGAVPVEKLKLDFNGPSKAASKKWEPIEGFPVGSTLKPGEKAEATWSYALQPEDFESGSFEVDFLASGWRQGEDAKVAAPGLHVTVPCQEFLSEYIILSAQVQQKNAWYLPGTTVPVKLTVRDNPDTSNRKLLRTRLYAVGDNCQTSAMGDKEWRDFGHGATGYNIGEMGSIDYGSKSMIVDVAIPKDFKGDVLRAAWVVEGDYYYGGRSARSNVAIVNLPVFPLADEGSELALDVELRSVCPHADGVWRSGDKVDVKLSAQYKGSGKAKRLTIEGADKNGSYPVAISGEQMNAVSDIVQLTLDDSLYKSWPYYYTFRAKANVKDAEKTDYVTDAHTLTFDLKPQDEGTISVTAGIVSENLNADGKWRNGDKARIRVEANYEGPVTPRKVEYSVFAPGNSESPIQHGDIWYSNGIADEFVIQLDTSAMPSDVLSYEVVAYACEGESTIYTCNASTSVVFDIADEDGGSGPDAGGLGPDEAPDGISDVSAGADPVFAATWISVAVVEAAAAHAKDGETAEAPAETGEGGEVAEVPTETGDGGEVTEAPAETGDGGEVAEVPAETGEGGEVAEAPTETGEGGEVAGAPSEVGESTEGEPAEPEAQTESTEAAPVEPEMQAENAEAVPVEPEMQTESAEAVPVEPEMQPDGAETEPAEPAYEESVATVAGAAYDIPATVCLPKGEGPFPAVVMLHDTGSNRDEAGNGYLYVYAAPVLAEKYGIATIRIDFPGNGDSAADYTQYNFRSAVADAKAAADYMAALDCIDGNAIGVMGWSQGGTDALLACAWEPETFKSLVTWAGAPDMMLDGFFTEADYDEAKQNGYFVMEFDWRDSLNVGLQWCDDVAGTDVLKAFSEGYRGPVLAIAGTDDDTVDPRWSRRIVDASANPKSRTYFIEGMDHTFNVFAEDDLHSLYRAVDATGAFFAETLGAYVAAD